MNFEHFFSSFIPVSSILLSPGSKKLETLVDLRDSIVLTPKNVQVTCMIYSYFIWLHFQFTLHIYSWLFLIQALRTLFNVAHRLHNILGPSWVLVSRELDSLVLITVLYLILENFEGLGDSCST
jgi:hypothetical protein